MFNPQNERFGAIIPYSLPQMTMEYFKSIMPAREGLSRAAAALIFSYFIWDDTLLVHVIELFWNTGFAQALTLLEYF